MWLWGPTFAGALVLAGCSFNPGGGAANRDGDPDAGGDDQAPLEWWDTAYRLRVPLAVTAGPIAPAAGYAGYTVRLTAFHTGQLISRGDLASDCGDLRVVRWSGSEWSEIDRHVIGCGGTVDVRFALAADIATEATDGSYYLYLGNPEAGAPAALDTGNVYLWYDDATVDRSDAYQRGRLDSWGSTNSWIDTLSWSDGSYEYLRGDDQVSSYRRAIAERDVYVEAQMLHTACFPGNMVTGLVVRGVVASGAGGDEEAEHYYASMRGHQDSCGGGYAFDGDIVAGVRDVTAVDGSDPPAVTIGAWRAQALAAWGAGPTHLSFWDLDGAWEAPGWPPASAVVAAGDPAVDKPEAGFAGIWMAQDGGRFRGMLIRRYVDPEPTVTARSPEELAPAR